MPQDTIENMCFKLQLNGNYLHQVTAFLHAHGDEATRKILLGIKQVVDHKTSNGLRPPSVAKLWKEASERYVDGADGRARAVVQQQEQMDAEKAYQKTKDGGYRPTKEVIRAQLEALSEKEELALRWRPDTDLPTSERLEQEQLWGIIGLKCVHDMTGIEEPVAEVFDINF